MFHSIFWKAIWWFLNWYQDVKCMWLKRGLVLEIEAVAAPRYRNPTVGIYCIGIEFFYELRGQKTVRTVFEDEDKANWHRNFIISGLIRGGIEYIEGPLPDNTQATDRDKLPMSEIASILH